MRQIRKSVFETNSSSMHALALQKDFNDNCESCRVKYGEIIPGYTVDLEISAPDEATDYDTRVYDENRDCTPVEIVVNKIKFVYYNIIGRMATSDYGAAPDYGYLNLTLFFSWLTKLGINYTIPYQPEMFYIDEDNIMEKHDAFFFELYPDELWEKIFDGTEKSFCNFLFGDGSQVNGYATDCISYDIYDEYVDDFEKEMKNGGKCELYQKYGG